MSKKIKKYDTKCKDYILECYVELFDSAVKLRKKYLIDFHKSSFQFLDKSWLEKRDKLEELFRKVVVDSKDILEDIENILNNTDEVEGWFQGLTEYVTHYENEREKEKYDTDTIKK